MTLQELHRLIHGGEGPTVEFKRPDIKPGDLAESFAALANSRGGVVLVGVDDDGRLVGVPSLKDARDLIEIAVRQALTPAQAVTVSELRSPRGPTILAARIRRSAQPVFSSSGRLLVRRGSRNVPVTPAEARVLFATTGQKDPPEYPYEILWQNIVLEIHDPGGQQATLTKTARVRFLQDHVLALSDRTWGSGAIALAPYPGPGIVADQFEHQQELHSLISLREPKHRGEVTTIETVHRREGGFTREQEWFDVEIDLPTNDVRFEVRFPQEREPSEAFLSERLSGTKHALIGANRIRDPHGRVRIVWRRHCPIVKECFRTEWRW